MVLVQLIYLANHTSHFFKKNNGNPDLYLNKSAVTYIY